MCLARRELLKGLSEKVVGRIVQEILSLSLYLSFSETKIRTPEHIPLILVSSLHLPGTHLAGSTRRGHPPRVKRENGSTFHKPTCYMTQLHSSICKGAWAGGMGPLTLTAHPITLNHNHTQTDMNTVWHRGTKQWHFGVFLAALLPVLVEISLLAPTETQTTIPWKQFWTWSCWPMGSKEDLMGLSQRPGCPLLS